MSSYHQIENKLKQFYKKYYRNQLLKGSLLFLAFGITYFIITSFVEYSFWLSSFWRTVLFWLFILVECHLLFRFIGMPLLKLLRATQGISDARLSYIVGLHFKEVEDKLLNILQLKNEDNQSDLIMASIEKKSKELIPIPFNNAISYTFNLKYVKYALLPFIFGAILFFTNLFSGFSNSFGRILDYQTAYSPPAPFHFQLLTNKLKVVQGEDFTVRFITKGDVTPNDASIFFDNQQYYVKNLGSGEFEFTFPLVQKDITFYLASNKVKSQNFTLSVMNTPRINKISLLLDFPSYTKKKDLLVETPSNLTVPEGTKITWSVLAENTENIDFIVNKKRISFSSSDKKTFLHTKKAKENFRYQLSSSNTLLQDYETLGFSVSVVKDEFPRIQVMSNLDSIVNAPVYFLGQVSDDFGLKKLQFVYQEEGNPTSKKTDIIALTKSSLQSFSYSFPSKLNLKEGYGYELYFEVFDNDQVNGSKKTQSKMFTYKVQTQEELEDKLLENQKNYINKLENSLLNKKQQKSELLDLQKGLQNKQNMNWNDQKNIENLVKRQKQYQQMMEKQTNNLLQNLDDKKEQNENLQTNKEELKKRIEELKELKQNQKILEELDKLAQKLNKDQLIKKTKQLAEQNKQQERSLQRILELTKRFYVEQKMNQLANKLQELAKEQSKLSNKPDSSKKQQEKINQKFDALEKELENLKKDNDELKKPMGLPDLSDEQYEVNKEQKKANNNLDKNKKQAAQQNQKKASKKMQEMSSKMQQTLSDMQSMSVEANASDLRKSLKNLITFSFQQEDLLSTFDRTDSEHPDFGKNLRRQNQLKTYFEHIDDSLYVLSMRVPQISTKIQKDLADAHYNLSESLENFSERRFNRGKSNQQNIMTSANNISDFLSDLLNNMNNNMSSSSKGNSSSSFNLPDIIQQQQGLSKQMKEGMGKQEEKEGNQKKEGEKGEEGKEKKGKGNKDEQSQNGDGEKMSGELYKIYQQQNQLKQQLEDLLKGSNDPNGEGKKVVKSMEQLENEILEKGFTQSTIQRMQNLEYQLLKLDKAALKQNQDKKRKSNTNKNRYQNTNLKPIELKKDYIKQLEILNRQSLPLQQNFKKRVQEYFKQY